MKITASSATIESRQASTAHRYQGTRLGSCVNVNLGQRVVWQLDFEFPAQGSRREADGFMHEQITAFAFEAPVITDMHLNVEVTGGGAGTTRHALPGQSKLNAIIDTRRYVNNDLAMPFDAPLTFAGAAWRRDSLPRSPALPAGTSKHDKATLTCHLTGATASGTSLGARPRSCSRSCAGIAWRHSIDFHFPLNAGHNVFEREHDVNLHMLAAFRTPA
jgi:hypothetical protein